MTCPPCTNDCNEGRTCPARSGNEIIEMARQALTQEPREDWNSNAWVFADETLKAFAALVAAKERERITAMLMYLHNQTSAYHNFYKHAAIEINRKDGEGELI